MFLVWDSVACYLAISANNIENILFYINFLQCIFRVFLLVIMVMQVLSAKKTMNKTHWTDGKNVTDDSKEQTIHYKNIVNDSSRQSVDQSPRPGNVKADASPILFIRKRLWSVIGSRSRCGYLYKRYVDTGHSDFGSRCYNACIGLNSVFVDLCWHLLI